MADGLTVEFRGAVDGNRVEKLHVLAAVVDANRRTKHRHNMVFLRDVERVERHFLRFARVGRIEAGDLRVHREIAGVLVRLRRVTAGIVAHDQHESAVQFRQRARHERIRRDVEPHLLHDRADALPRERRAQSRLERDFLVRAPLDLRLRLQFVRPVRNGGQNLRRRRSRIGARHLASGLDDPPSDRLIAHQNRFRSHCRLPLPLHGHPSDRNRPCTSCFPSPGTASPPPP